MNCTEHIVYPMQPTNLPTNNLKNTIHTKQYSTKISHRHEETSVSNIRNSSVRGAGNITKENALRDRIDFSTKNIRRCCTFRRRYSLFIPTNDIIDLETFEFHKNQEDDNEKNLTNSLLASTKLQNKTILIRASGNNFNFIEIFSIFFDNDKILATNLIKYKNLNSYKIGSRESKVQDIEERTCRICRQKSGICFKPNKLGHLRYIFQRKVIYSGGDDSIVDIKIFKVSKGATSIYFCVRTKKDMLYRFMLETSDSNKKDGNKLCSTHNEVSSPLTTKPSKEHENYLKQLQACSNNQHAGYKNTTSTSTSSSSSNNNNIHFDGNHSHNTGYYGIHTKFDDSTDSDSGSDQDMGEQRPKKKETKQIKPGKDNANYLKQHEAFTNYQHASYKNSSSNSSNNNNIHFDGSHNHNTGYYGIHTKFDNSTDRDRRNAKDIEKQQSKTSNPSSRRRQGEKQEYFTMSSDETLKWNCRSVFNLKSVMNLRNEEKQQILTMATSPYSKNHLFVMYKNAAMALLDLSGQNGADVPHVYNKLMFNYNVVLPDTRIISNFHPNYVSCAYGHHPLKILIGYKNKLYEIFFSTQAKTSQQVVFTLPKRVDVEYKEIISSISLTKVLHEVLISTNYSVYIIDLRNKGILHTNIVHSWNHHFNNGFTPSMINYVKNISFEHDNTLVENNSRLSNTKNSADVDNHIHGEIYFAATYQNPQVLFCPRIIQPSTISLHGNNPINQYGRSIEKNEADYRDFLMSKETVLPQKFHIKRAWDALNQNDQQYFTLEKKWGRHSIYKINHAIEQQKSCYLKGTTLIENIHSHEGANGTNQFLFCMLDNNGNTFIDECKIVIHTKNTMFPYDTKQKIQRLPVGTDIHGKIKYEKPLSYENYCSNDSKSNINLVEKQNLILSKCQTFYKNIIFPRNDDKDTVKQEGEVVLKDQSIDVHDILGRDLDQSIRNINIPQSISEIANLLYKKKFGGSNCSDLDYVTIDRMVGSIVQIRALVEEKTIANNNLNQQIRCLRISDKLSMPLPSRITYMAKKTDVRTCHTSNTLKKIEQDELGLDRRSPPTLQNKILDTVKKYKLDNVSTVCFPVDNCNGNKDEVDDEFDDTVDIEVKDLLLLDKLKSLWRSSNTQVYVTSMNENVRRKKKNVVIKPEFRINI
jgi:hypothetical protein